MVDFYKTEDGAVLLNTRDVKPKNLSILEANSVDAAVEKHVPVVSVENGKVVVRIGSQPHPMVPEHYIEWVYVKTSFGGVYCTLSPDDPPEVTLDITPSEVEEVYIHCNLHGLWKAKEPVLPLDFDLNTVACSPEFTAGCLDPSKK